MNPIERLNKTKVVTGRVILHHPYLFEAKKFRENSVAKYRTVIVIPSEETETLDKINKAIDEAILQGEYIFGGAIPKREDLMLPLRNGNDSDSLDLVYYNNFYLNASNDVPPRVVNKDNLPFLDKISVPDCIYARVSIMFKAYNYKGNKGVSCILNNVMLFDEIFNPSKYLSSPKEDFS